MQMIIAFLAALLLSLPVHANTQKAATAIQSDTVPAAPSCIISTDHPRTFVAGHAAPLKNDDGFRCHVAVTSTPVNPKPEPQRP